MNGAAEWGALLFGVVVGWITYRTLVRSTAGAQVSDIATVIGAVGGAAVTALFDDEDLFGRYAIGLFIGFVAYILVFFLLNGREKTAVVMGKEDRTRIGATGN